MGRTRLDFHPSTPEDLYEIPGLDTSDFKNVGVLEKNYLEKFARTFTKDGKPFALIGITPIWKGCAQVWSYIDKETIKGYFQIERFVFATTKRGIDDYQRLLNLHRVSMHVECDDPAAIRFAEHLGFSLEGRMIQHGPDRSDHFMYAKLWEVGGAS
jgi:RimJ/RimL family protein N-acetyltransferase